MVPVSASSNRPSRRSAAPVNAPFSWPNSSDSSSVSGSAAQLTVMKGLPRRGERSCSALATSSLPVPLSPWTSTVLETGAICSILTSTSWIAALSPMIPVRSCSRRRSISRRAVSTISSGRAGFIIVSVTPSRLDPLRPLGVGRLQQREGGDLRVPGQRRELDGVRLVHRAGQDHQVGILPADRAPGVVEGGEHRGGEAGRLQRRVQRDRGLEIVHRDEDLGRHGRKSNRLAQCVEGE